MEATTINVWNGRKEEIAEVSPFDLFPGLAKTIAYLLREFKNQKRVGILYSKSYPDGIPFDAEGYTNDTEWFLDELLWTFDTIANDNIHEWNEQTYDRVNAGLRLFSDRFLSLWD